MKVLAAPMADAHTERTDLNVLRGLAGLYMVIHHVWARYPVPVSGLGRALVELGSSAPVLFFFATGEGGRHTFSRTFAEHNRKRRDLNR